MPALRPEFCTHILYTIMLAFNNSCTDQHLKAACRHRMLSAHPPLASFSPANNAANALAIYITHLRTCHLHPAPALNLRILPHSQHLQVTEEKETVVEPKKAIVDAEVAKAAQAAEAANSIKRECEAALAVALPVLEAALYALAFSAFGCVVLCNRR